MSRESETAIIPVSAVVSGSIVPRFESVFNKDGLNAMPGNNLDCITPAPCQACYVGCVGCNLIPESGQQPDKLIGEKLSVGSVGSAEVLIR